MVVQSGEKESRSRRSITLTDAAWLALDRLALRVGEKTWRSLIAGIANNDSLIESIALYLNAQGGQVRPIQLPNSIIVRPVEVRTATIAWVVVDGRTVRVYFPEKHDEFREVIKASEYQWKQPYWERTYTDQLGDIAHRAAETCHRLLAAGFCVAPPTPEIREMSITASYNPEPRRMILTRASEKSGSLFVIWWSRSEDCYNVAKTITGARYKKPSIVVPPEHVEEVVDFAQEHGFSFSPDAQALVEEARAMLHNALIVDVPPLPRPAAFIPTKIPELNPADVAEGIDDELADDPL